MHPDALFLAYCPYCDWATDPDKPVRQQVALRLADRHIAKDHSRTVVARRHFAQELATSGDLAYALDEFDRVLAS